LILESKENNPPGNNFLTRPLSMRGWPSWVIYLLSLAGLIYLLNPGMGIFELIPDNIPFIGNLDEGVATMLIWYGVLEMLETKCLRKKSK
jgi:hypothetical protein